METANVITEGECQTIRLPKGYRFLTATVQVSHQGEAVLLEPVKPREWPTGFFEKIHITDPAFQRPPQGTLPLIKPL